MSWLKRSAESVQTVDGKLIEVWDFDHQPSDTVLKAWAKHFRNHYCCDTQIDRLIRGTSYSKADYLKLIKFPDGKEKPGPSIRAGDFGEILAADFLEFTLGYWVPRTRYANRAVRNESTKGSDTIGFLFEVDGKESKRDKLAIFESKAKLSGEKASTALQTAVDHSSKDVLRKAESLNAIKQRLLDLRDEEGADRVERFQNELDHPYTQVFGAVAHLDENVFDAAVVGGTNCSGHVHPDDLMLVVIKGSTMMKLVHELYRRAADEA